VCESRPSTEGRTALTMEIHMAPAATPFFGAELRPVDCPQIRGQQILKLAAISVALTESNYKEQR
jgi:hypothetical protein